MANLLGIGISGLRVNQTALQVTGNNIANADVESYSRQDVSVVTSKEQSTLGGFIGSGTEVASISRIDNQFLRNQIQLDTSSFNSLKAFGENIEQLDSLLAGELSSLSPGIASLFSALEVSIEDPTSTPARQLVLSEAEGLVERIHTVYDRLIRHANDVSDQMSALSARVTALANGIAELNESIGRETNLTTGGQPNALLDARDEQLRQLAELVSIRTSKDDSGSVNVFIANGQPLVVGAIASSVGVQPSANDAEILDLVFVGNGGASLPITGSISGGELGGVVRFRDESLEPALNAVGRISLAIADELNQQNKQGLDLEGNFGSLIFEDINTDIVMGRRSKTLAGTANLNVLIQDISKLTTDNYVLTVTNAVAPEQANLVNQTTGEIITGQFQLTDHDSDAATADVNLFVPTDPTKTEGVNIYVDTGALGLNDRFFIRPTRDGAYDIEVQMERPEELAYAAPIVTDASLNNSDKGSISAGTVLQAFDRFGNPSPAFAAPNTLTPPISIVFTSATTYDVIDSTGPTVLLNATFTPGQSNPVFSTDPSVLPPAVPPALAPFYQGYQVELSGAPQQGDTFTIGFNSNGISDNRNGVAMGRLRIDGTLEGNSLNFEDGYGKLVEEIGSDTAQNRVSRESSESLLKASLNSRSAESGVNLDEEAANLIKFEQAYNASAQVINIARQIFDSLLNAFR